MQGHDHYIGHGLSLRKANVSKGSYKDYVFLFKEEKQLYTYPFRKENSFISFNEKESRLYCKLLSYKYDYGLPCIIDSEGTIIIQSHSTLSKVNYRKGVIAVVDNEVINLITKEKIVKHVNYLSSNDFLFSESLHSAKYESGIYMIEYATGSYVVIK